MTIDTLASFIAYGGIAIPHNQREALIAALRIHLQIAKNDLDGATCEIDRGLFQTRYDAIAAAIQETECFLGMHGTPSPNPSPVNL